jgi:hypothetical protein
VTARHAAAIALWTLAWACAVLAAAALLAVRNGERATARRDLAARLTGTAVLAGAGAVLW